MEADTAPQKKRGARPSRRARERFQRKQQQEHQGFSGDVSSLLAGGLGLAHHTGEEDVVHPQFLDMHPGDMMAKLQNFLGAVQAQHQQQHHHHHQQQPQQQQSKRRGGRGHQAEPFCPLCGEEYGGSLEEHLQEHANRLPQERGKGKRHPTPTPVDPNTEIITSTSVLEPSLEKQCYRWGCAALLYATPLVEDHHRYEAKLKVLRELEAAMCVRFPGTTLWMFGSSVQGVATRTSDLDVAAKLGDQHDLTTDQQRVILQGLDSVLPGICRKILDTRVPIVIGRNQEAPLDWDLSLQHFGVRNSYLIQRYLKTGAEFRIAGIVIKHWSMLNNVIDSKNGFLTSYAVIIMFIYYCVKAGYMEHIPPEEVQVGVPQPTFEPLQFHTLTEEYVVKIGRLFCGFLHYYSKVFDFDKYVVTLNVDPTQRMVKKEELDWTPRDTDPTADVRSTTNFYICVQDPYEELENGGLNLGRHLDTIKLSTVAHALNEASRVFVQHSSPHSAAFMDARCGNCRLPINVEAMASYFIDPTFAGQIKCTLCGPREGIGLFNTSNLTFDDLSTIIRMWTQPYPFVNPNMNMTPLDLMPFLSLLSSRNTFSPVPAGLPAPSPPSFASAVHDWTQQLSISPGRGSLNGFDDDGTSTMAITSEGDSELSSLPESQRRGQSYTPSPTSRSSGSRNSPPSVADLFKSLKIGGRIHDGSSEGRRRNTTSF